MSQDSPSKELYPEEILTYIELIHKKGIVEVIRLIWKEGYECAEYQKLGGFE